MSDGSFLFVDLRFFVVNRALGLSLSQRRLTGDGSPSLVEGEFPTRGGWTVAVFKVGGANARHFGGVDWKMCVQGCSR